MTSTVFCLVTIYELLKTKIKTKIPVTSAAVAASAVAASSVAALAMAASTVADSAVAASAVAASPVSASAVAASAVAALAAAQTEVTSLLADPPAPQLRCTGFPGNNRYCSGPSTMDY